MLDVAAPPAPLVAAAGPAASPQPRHAWKPKGYLSPLGLVVVLLLAIVPLLMVLLRVVAGPGMSLPGIPMAEYLRQFGAMLDRTATLEWVPRADRSHVIYLLLLPSAGLIITITRLTFGLRILGYRAILIAVGFEEIGVWPSLVLMAVVIGIIALLRPVMKRVRLPMYARISLIFSITACLMVVALFAGPWLRSELIWSVAFFPVIILAMMAESITGTMDQKSVASAAWRMGWTMVLALILWLMHNPTVTGVLLRFPELMLTQIAAIMLVSEYLDLRLLQDWQSHYGGFSQAAERLLGGSSAAVRRQPRVAVVRNRWHHGVIARLGRAAPASGRVHSIRHLVDGLRDEGYAVKVFEGDITLLRELQKFLPPHPRTGAPGGVVLNLATGIQGLGRLGHVAAMLEMAGLSYTGPDPITHARLQDRLALLTSLQQAGVPVPPFRLLHGRSTAVDLDLPLCVSPRYEPDVAGIVVRRIGSLGDAIDKVIERHGPDVIVESWIEGPEVRATLLGTTTLECLPLMAIDAAGKQRACPPAMDDALSERIRDCARQAFCAAGCRDYARIDLRIGATGMPCVVRVQSHDILARNGSVAAMAAAAGLDWGGLARRIVESAAARTGAEAVVGPRPDNVVPLVPVTHPAAHDTRDATRPAAGAR